MRDVAVPRALADALADELVRATARLGDLAYDLGSDDETLRRHMASIQAIDLVTQTQLAVADVLRATAAVDERIAGVTLEDVAGRLRAAMAQAAA